MAAGFMVERFPRIPRSLTRPEKPGFLCLDGRNRKGESIAFDLGNKPYRTRLALPRVLAQLCRDE